MSKAKNPKDIYDVRVHRFGERRAEELALKEKEEILKNQPWKRSTEEERKYISSGSNKSQSKGNVGAKTIYTVDQITVAIILYGKNSAIHRAMINGEKVSLLIRASIEEKLKRGIAKDTIEESLLLSCVKRENEMAV